MLTAEPVRVMQGDPAVCRAQGLGQSADMDVWAACSVAIDLLTGQSPYVHVGYSSMDVPNLLTVRPSPGICVCAVIICK